MLQLWYKEEILSSNPLGLSSIQQEKLNKYFVVRKFQFGGPSYSSHCNIILDMDYSWAPELYWRLRKAADGLSKYLQQWRPINQYSYAGQLCMACLWDKWRWVSVILGRGTWGGGNPGMIGSPSRQRLDLSLAHFSHPSRISPSFLVSTPPVPPAPC